MKNATSCFLFFLLFFCLQKAKSQTAEYEVQKIVIGDINNDKIIDTAYVKSPKFIDDKDGWGDCKDGNCLITVGFSCQYPDIVLKNAVAGDVENIGDIDGDGISEIIIIPSWFVGCWGQIHFFTLKNKKWKNVGTARRNICQEESYLKGIKKIKGKKIHVLEEIMEDGDVVKKWKVMPIK